jgi:type I restriction enzyme S subunit
VSWKPRRLDQCAKFASGGTPSKANAAYWSGDIPWVSSGEMSQSFLEDTDLHVSSDGAESGTRMVPKHTVLAVVRGMSLANEFRISITQREMTFNQDIKALHCAEGIDPYFLFYALKARKNHIRQLATEASHGTKKLETDTLSAVEILVPETLEAQKSAASIALNYDDLIENNRRRIGLLEEAARQLYKEWFVRFRFPGHEHVRIIDGVPAGWTKEKLSDLAIATYGHAFKSELFSEEPVGRPVVRIRDVPDRSSQTWTTEEAPTGKTLENGDFLIGMDGDFHMNFWAGGTAWLNQRVVRLMGKGCFSTGLLRVSIERQIMDLNETITGTTVKHLGAKHLDRIDLLVPPRALLDQSNEFCEKTRELVVNLSSQNLQLARARDLLLPKLMNGAIAV